MSSDISENGHKRIYRILCSLAWCDGNCDEAERKRLEGYRERFGMDQATAAALEEEGRHSKELKIGKKASEREFLVHAMVDIVSADRRLARREERRILKIGKTLGIDIQELVQWLRTGLGPHQHLTALDGDDPSAD